VDVRIPTSPCLQAVARSLRRATYCDGATGAHCGQCGAPLDLPLEDNRCAGCGHETHFADGAFTGGGALTSPVEVPPGRDWRQKWREIAYGIQRLQTVYSANVITGDELDRQIEDLFGYLRELADWLDEEEFSGVSVAKRRCTTWPIPRWGLVMVWHRPKSTASH
jgi:hypothetical protein